ncbi:MAG: DNA-3-methyladenine glycosylase [Rubrivivax sp.]|nr:MAG: DNA-3-methyladenine glycosylase [Rubrivivax sp.]
MHIDFLQSPVVVARSLIGWTLLVNGVGGVIVETEAYDMDDEASHSFRGMTARNAAMFGEPGTAYVYRSYGLHWCLNLVCGPSGHGAAVLVRALEPTNGIDTMQQRRGVQALRLLTTGPGRVAQALGVDRSLDGLPLDRPPFALSPPGVARAVSIGVRVGITKAADRPWRFAMTGSAHLSRKL